MQRAVWGPQLRTTRGVAGSLRCIRESGNTHIRADSHSRHWVAGSGAWSFTTRCNGVFFFPTQNDRKIWRFGPKCNKVGFPLCHWLIVMHIVTAQFANCRFHFPKSGSVIEPKEAKPDILKVLFSKRCEFSKLFPDFRNKIEKLISAYHLSLRQQQGNTLCLVSIMRSKTLVL